jgi:hypothetical protein
LNRRARELSRFINAASESEEPVESDASEANELAIPDYLETRRQFIKQVAGTGVAIAIGPNLVGSGSLDQISSPSNPAGTSGSVKVNLKINGKSHALDLDPRVTLLDALRERLHPTVPRRDAITANAAPAPCWSTGDESIRASRMR